jgi:hypothetical protein
MLEHQPKRVSSSITKETVDLEDNDALEDVELTTKIREKRLTDCVKKLLKTFESKDVEDFFMKIKFYKVDVLKTHKYFCQQLIEESELNEQFSTKFDDSVKSIIFYRNTQLPYFTSKNLCSGVLEGLEKYYSQSGVTQQSTADYIIKLLTASMQTNEGIYEKVVKEYEKFDDYKRIFDYESDLRDVLAFKILKIE